MLSAAKRIQLLLIFNHCLFALAIWYAPAHWLLVTLVGWLFIGKIGGEIGLHRYFAHASFKTSRFGELTLLILASLCCIGSPLSWVGVHRQHHLSADTSKDPHGMLAGWKIWLTLWQPFQISPRLVSDLIRNKWHVWIHRNYYLFIFSIFLLLGLIHPFLPVFLISGSSVLVFHSAGLVNTLCHRYGYRNFETADSSFNNTLVNLLTLGSGLHNNHHKFPGSWSNKILKWEWDLPGWLIKWIFISPSVIEHGHRPSTTR